VTVVDLDANNFVHWALINLPPTTTSLPEGASPGASLPPGAIDLLNDFGKKGYGGPCPPRGQPHNYVFRVTALKAMLSASKADRRFFLDLDANALAQGEISGTFKR
jgi:Raf kinase inhibitor-like YbhB/YbcL family protein